MSRILSTLQATTSLTTPIVTSAGALAVSPAGTLTFNPSSSISFSSKVLGDVALPVTGTDGANKNYVDQVAQGLSVKQPCIAATTTALPAYTYNNGTSGVGATLTANANGALPAIDGVTLVAQDRVLIKNEAAVSPANNGIYVVTQVGGAGAPFILTRATDFDQAAEIPGSFTFIQQGTVNADSGWVCTTDAPVVVGTTAITFVQFSSAGVITAGNGLQKIGNTISVLPADTTITASGSGTAVNQGANYTWTGTQTFNSGASVVTSGVTPLSITGTGAVSATTSGPIKLETTSGEVAHTTTSGTGTFTSSGAFAMGSTAGAVTNTAGTTMTSTAASTNTISSTTSTVNLRSDQGIVASNAAGTAARKQSYATVQTTDGTVTTIATFTTTSNSTTYIKATVKGYNGTGTNAGAWVIQSAYRNVAGTVAQLGSPDFLGLSGNPFLTVAITVSGADLLVRVTGAAATTIDWAAEVQTF